MFRKLVIAAAIAVSAGVFGVPAAMAADVYVRTAPPPPRHEVVPEPRRGHIWVPGHWDWRNRHHVWIAGHFERERRGYRYREPVWEERDGRWHMQRGGWQRGDRDGDGVPNRVDQQPDNPRRY